METTPKDKTPGDFAIYRRLLRYTWPYRGRLMIGILCGGLYAAANGGLLWFVNKGIPNFFPKAPVSVSVVVAEPSSGRSLEIKESPQQDPSQIRSRENGGMLAATPKLGRFTRYADEVQAKFARGLQGKFSTTGLIILMALILPVVGLVRGVADYMAKYQIRWVGSRVVMELRNALFEKLNTLSLSYFVSSRTGELIARTTNDPMAVENAVSVVVEDVAKQPLTLVVAVVALITIDPWLALISLVLFPVCILPVAVFGRRVRRFTREAQQRVADLVSVLQEMISGVRVVKAFGMEPYETGRFGEQNQAFFRRTIKVARANAAVEPIIVFISTIGVSMMLIYIWKQKMAFSEFLTYAAALYFMYEPVKKLSRIHLQIQQAVAAADRIFEVLDTPVVVAQRPGAGEFHGKVEVIAFENIVFSYGEGNILDGVSLDVQAGQRIAIVGGSGSGKTTLVSLLPRFYDVSGGALKINGTDVRDLTIPSLRRLMGIVTQDTILFNDTVASNISYGSREARRDAIVEAAKQANAHAFIMDMPEQYETRIGDLGVRLSGGQKQRLAIARAMLRNPPIMILDEATSALDTESERLVQAALHKLMTGRTVFAIAHRLSTIVDCDRIIVLDKGRIVESGRHEDLLKANGHYKRLYDLQFAG
jgi:subfamily B ATP-binding cassette protein MsbA